jgi:hypothetical protein
MFSNGVQYCLCDIGWLGSQCAQAPSLVAQIKSVDKSKNFTDDLKDPQSEKYKQYEREFTFNFKTTLSNKPGIVSDVRVAKFVPGSVQADIVVLMSRTAENNQGNVDLPTFKRFTLNQLV